MDALTGVALDAAKLARRFGHRAFGTPHLLVAALARTNLLDGPAEQSLLVRLAELGTADEDVCDSGEPDGNPSDEFVRRVRASLVAAGEPQEHVDELIQRLRDGTNRVTATAEVEAVIQRARAETSGSPEERCLIALVCPPSAGAARFMSLAGLDAQLLQRRIAPSRAHEAR